MKNQKSYLFTSIILSFQLLTSHTVLEANPGTTAIEFKQPNFDLDALEESLGFKLSQGIKKYYKEIDKEGVTPVVDPVRDGWVEYRNIDGWFDKRLIIILAIIDNFQQQQQINGNLGEIGVWQGRSFIPLLKLAKINEYALAIDCFELYQFNRDDSGGDVNVLFKLFMNNVKKYSFNHKKLRVIKGDSYKLLPQDLLDATHNKGGFRIFSIDGCHEAATTDRDMQNAFDCLVDGGVIIMDDYFSPNWPGVSEGVNSFMQKNDGKVKPFFIAWNKIFFTQPEHAPKYLELIKKFIVPKDATYKKFFNVETLIYDPKL